MGANASRFSELNAEVVVAKMTVDYKIIDNDGVIYSKGDLSAYIAELRKIGSNMDITDVVVDGSTACCKWQLGDIIVDAGLITLGDEGVSHEQLLDV
ncbi:MAG: hypothetical protein ACI8W7_002394 [Gammaproteobacteria bacterium]